MYSKKKIQCVPEPSLLEHSLYHKSWDFSSDFSGTEDTNELNCEDQHDFNYNKTLNLKSSVISNTEICQKLIIVGDAGVGKSCFIERYVSGTYPDIQKWTAGGNFCHFLKKLLALF